MKMLGSLLASAASATAVDGGIRMHPKYDNTAYTYDGRSYGMGASAGLVDASIANNPLALSYTYQETGLRADVGCIYNSSTEFAIYKGPDVNIYPVAGKLPNSGNSTEYSEYYGHSPDAIVAIGVAAHSATTDRILGIAASKSYAALNATQCNVTFAPRIFDVSVGLQDRFIKVNESPPGDIDAAARDQLTHTLLRQFELISNDQTSLYVSVLGDSFNSSIASYNSSIASTTGSSRNSSSAAASRPDEASATLAGLTNSITAMVDDLLVAYSSAQLMVTKDTCAVPVVVKVHAFRYGTGLYIYLTFAINTVIVLLVVGKR